MENMLEIKCSKVLKLIFQKIKCLKYGGLDTEV